MNLNQDYQVATVNGRAVTKAELTAVFNRVCDSENWKNPINAVVYPEHSEEFALITEAVIFFTGSVPKFFNNGNGAFRVKAAGYYATIGA